MDLLKDLFHAFIPHAENEYKPRFFRVRAVFTIALIIVLLSVAAFSLQNILLRAHTYLAAVIASALVDLTNIDRATNELPSLMTNPVLERAAQLKANDMAAKGYFAHQSPEGYSPWHWFKEAGYSFTYAGENLAVYFSDSADVERAWMNSPSHRANILNSHFTEVGIATAKGVYQGKETVFVVQMFGRPSAQKVAVVDTPSNAPAEETVILVTQPVVEDVVVAGASVEEVPTQVLEQVPVKVLSEDETFIAIKSEVATNSPLAINDSYKNSVSLVQRAVTSPRSMMNTIFLALGIVIAVGLALMIGIEYKRQHPMNVLYGVLLLVLMAAILYFWQFGASGGIAIL